MSNVSLDTKRYLDHIGSRITTYFNSMNRAKEFVLTNGIYDQELIMNCIVMSLLWVASVRGEELSEDELFMFLGLETNLAEQKVININPDMKDWGLEEVLEYVIKNS